MYPYPYQPYSCWPAEPPMGAAPMPAMWGQPAPQVVYVYIPYMPPMPPMPPFGGPQGGPGRGPEGYGGRPQGGPGRGPEGYGGGNYGGGNYGGRPQGGPGRGGEGYAGGNYGGKPHGGSYAGEAAVKPFDAVSGASAKPGRHGGGHDHGPKDAEAAGSEANAQ